MGKKISAAAQQKAAEELAKAISSIDGVSAELDSRASGTQVRHTEVQHQLQTHGGN